MKKLLLIFASLFILGITSYAQVHVEAGLGLSDIKADYPKTDGRMCIVAGAGYDFSISEKFSIDPMLQLSFQGKSEYGILYTKIPIVFFYKVVDFDFGIGPYAAYGIWGEDSGEERYYDWTPGATYDPWYPDSFGYFGRFDVGIVAKVRYNFSKCYFGFEGSYGLLNMGREYTSGRFDGHTMSANVIFGYRF